LGKALLGLLEYEERRCAAEHYQVRRPYRPRSAAKPAAASPEGRRGVLANDRPRGVTEGLGRMVPDPLRPSARTAAEGSWIVRFRPDEAAGVRLFCFHHAGGGASAYRPWVDRLPPDLELCAVQLPGREGRLRERPFQRMAEMIPVVTRAIEPLLDRPFVLFGHSLGGMLAFETARELVRSGAPAPAHLFVSGRRAPTSPERDPRVSLLPDERLIEEVRRRWDGIPAAVLEEPELLELLLPTLRADLTLVESYLYGPGSALDCPLSCFGGMADPSTSPVELARWRDHTSGPFSLRMFSGAHFFVQSAREQVLAAVQEDLGPLLARLRRRGWR
jgi:medium-chain acyl-[acyl-carrier-protein] hydrolase